MRVLRQSGRELRGTLQPLTYEPRPSPESRPLALARIIIALMGFLARAVKGKGAAVAVKMEIDAPPASTWSTGAGTPRALARAHARAHAAAAGVLAVATVCEEAMRTEP